MKITLTEKIVLSHTIEVPAELANVPIDELENHDFIHFKMFEAIEKDGWDSSTVKDAIWTIE